MFESIKFWWKKGKKNKVIIDTEPKARIEIVDPSKDKVEKDVGSLPGVVEDSGIVRSEGHVSFKKNTRTITRRVNKEKLRKSLEERKTSFYNNDGELYGENE